MFLHCEGATAPFHAPVFLTAHCVQPTLKCREIKLHFLGGLFAYIWASLYVIYLIFVPAMGYMSCYHHPEFTDENSEAEGGHVISKECRPHGSLFYTIRSKNRETILFLE